LSIWGEATLTLALSLRERGSIGGDSSLLRERDTPGARFTAFLLLPVGEGTLLVPALPLFSLSPWERAGVRAPDRT